MRPTQAVFRPLTARVMEGAAGRYTRFPNKLHARGMITLKDHLVRFTWCAYLGVALNINVVLLEGDR